MNLELSGDFNRITREPLDLLEQLAKSIGTTEAALLSTGWVLPQPSNYRADFRKQAFHSWKPMRNSYRPKRRYWLEAPQDPLY